jgi:predicted DNA-binding transcriptional regulator YafY
LLQTSELSERTIARDVERLRLSGVPISTHPGRAGGISLNPIKTTFSLQLDLPEVAALLSSLTVLGPTTSGSAASAMRKIMQAMNSG